MNPRQRREVARARTAAGVLVLPVLLGACGGGSVNVDEVETSKARVLTVARELLDGLTRVGSFPKPPRAGWSGCDDLGGKVAYRVSGRLDAAGGSAAGLVERVRGHLVEAGVPLRDVSAPGDDPTTLQGDSRGVQVQVTGYPDRPLVLLTLVGPCIDVGADDAELLAEPPERVMPA